MEMIISKDGRDYVLQSIVFNTGILRYYYPGEHFVGFSYRNELQAGTLADRVAKAGKNGLMPSLIKEITHVIDGWGSFYENYQLAEDCFIFYFYLPANHYWQILAELRGWANLKKFSNCVTVDQVDVVALIQQETKQRNKRVAMIPVRLGSKRIPKKNLRLLDGKPLVAYIIEAAIASECFDEIYLNSESEVFEPIAKKYGIKFYKRDPSLATDETTNDEFVEDFMNNVECRTVIQLLATSPFISPDDIKAFVDQMSKQDFGGFSTQISVKKIQIECVCKGTAINFYRFEDTRPSQELEPVLAYACGIMGWNREIFLIARKIARNSTPAGAYHGTQGTISYFELKGYATVDIDTEDDFLVAESILRSLKMPKPKPSYYDPTVNENIESDVPSILQKDGIIDNDFSNENQLVLNIHRLIFDKMRDNLLANEFQEAGATIQNWSRRIINTFSNSATLICQQPGQGNRRHYHSDWDEWWFILSGIWQFEVDGQTKNVEHGDIVLIERGKVHQIMAIGDKPAIRLAVSRADVDHIYV